MGEREREEIDHFVVPSCAVPGYNPISIANPNPLILSSR